MAGNGGAAATSSSSVVESVLWCTKLSDPWYEFVRSGIKKYEGRWNRDKVLAYKVGDTLEFSPHGRRIHAANECFRKKIAGITAYATFEDALKELPLDAILPGVKSVADAIAIYSAVYSLEDQKASKAGVVMIELTDTDTR